MRKYEGVFIFLPNLEEGEREAILNERIKSVIEGNGEITNIDEWGLRKLAYPIDDIGEGYYVLVNFTTVPEVKNEVERRVKIADNVMRHMIVRED